MLKKEIKEVRGRERERCGRRWEGRRRGGIIGRETRIEAQRNVEKG